MKKICIILIFSLFCFGLIVYSFYDFGLIPMPYGNTENVAVDYGYSELYSKEDMDEAIAVIKEEFRKDFLGCELHTITYVSDDECSESNLRWMNELGDAQEVKEHFTQCIYFESSFHTAKHEPSGSGLEDDCERTHWGWYLARSDDGEWKLMTWGEG